MDDEHNQTRLFLLVAVWALWLGAVIYSVVFLLTEPATGDGFTRGMNRITGFLGWQGVAGTLAVGVWGVGRGFAKGSGARRISAVPLWLALALVLSIVALVVWLRFNPG